MCGRIKIPAYSRGIKLFPCRFAFEHSVEIHVRLPGRLLVKKGGTCDLEAPVARSNTFSDYKEMDYSDKIGTGTYRIIVR